MGMLVRDTGLGSRAHGSPVDGHFSVSFSQSACWKSSKCLWSSKTILAYEALWRLLVLWSLVSEFEGRCLRTWMRLVPGTVPVLHAWYACFSAILFEPSLPPAPWVTLWIPIGYGTLHTHCGAMLVHEKEFSPDLASMKQINALNTRMKGKAKSLLKCRFCWPEMFISFFFNGKQFLKAIFFR